MDHREYVAEDFRVACTLRGRSEEWRNASISAANRSTYWCMLQAMMADGVSRRPAGLTDDDSWMTLRS